MCAFNLRFMEFEVEVAAKEKSKVIQRPLSGTGVSGTQSEMKGQDGCMLSAERSHEVTASCSGEIKATVSASETDTKRTNRCKRTKEKRATKSGNGPRAPPAGQQVEVDVKVLEERALEDYIAVMEALDHARIGERLEFRGQNEDEREAGGSLLEYLNELCSQKDFVTKVEAVLNMEYLSSLLSSDPEAIDLLSHEVAQVGDGPHHHTDTVSLL
ncbi:hypothetical protein DPEC_G00096270 [Dallia pectoralis]|uniref:Uncharacterized protein n=1 Tax=Dallia pectoralis TaxID=75939 RepID=A0ACC2GW00_DALPE|nr:hypothetical protein DPEC_G00096270 [Dallia pectoralis]